MILNVQIFTFCRITSRKPLKLKLLYVNCYKSVLITLQYYIVYHRIKFKHELFSFLISAVNIRSLLKIQRQVNVCAQQYCYVILIAIDVLKEVECSGISFRLGFLPESCLWVSCERKQLLITGASSHRTFYWSCRTASFRAALCPATIAHGIYFWNRGIVSVGIRNYGHVQRCMCMFLS